MVTDAGIRFCAVWGLASMNESKAYVINLKYIKNMIITLCTDKSIIKLTTIRRVV